jgi:hypothetical protein
MKHSYLILGLICLCSCFSSGPRLTSSTYDSIQLGTPIVSVEQEYGKPYAVHSKGGVKEYEYIERIDLGYNVVTENHYFIVVTDGKVVGKYTKREKPPAYNLIYQEDPNWNP